MKGWVGWVSCRSSVGQGKFASQRPTFYRLRFTALFPRQPGELVPETLANSGFWFLLLVISPEMTSVRQMSVPPSVGPCDVNIFKSLRLRDRCVNVDDTWHIYSVGRGTLLFLLSRILNFSRCAAHGHSKSELSSVGRDDPPERDVYFYIISRLL